MIEENITLILLAVIGLVFLIDFIKNNSKKSINEVLEKLVKKQEFSKSSNIINGILGAVLIFIIYFLLMMSLDPPDRLPFYYYISTGHLEAFYLFLLTYSYVPIILTIYINRVYFLKRKKNLALSLISIPFLKVLVHYMWFPETRKIVVNAFPNDNNDLFGYTKITEDIRETFGYHLDLIFTDRLELFIPVSIVFLIVVWFFNDKIKAQ